MVGDIIGFLGGKAHVLEVGMDDENKTFQIAIDGPVAAGKGTVSKLVAERLGFLYVDTGATYRVATLIAMRAGLSFAALDGQEEQAVEKLVGQVRAAKIMLTRPEGEKKDGRFITVVVNDEDVSWAIRDERVSQNVALVAKISEIRQVLVEVQQQIASAHDVVMEGRDITYRVLPGAALKIYLDAAVEERAKRRFGQLLDQGKEVSFEKVKADLVERDRIDTQRETDPLKILPDAWYLDTSTMGIEEVVETIVGRAREMMKDKEEK